VKRKHHNLKVWQEAMQLVKAVYAATTSFPKEESYGLTSQIRRAAISIPSNIAGGAPEPELKSFLDFYRLLVVL
jgi:four helix bundle protein